MARLNTPEALQEAIDKYFEKVEKTEFKTGVKIKEGSNENGSFSSEEHGTAKCVPTLVGLLLHLGLLEREWAAMQADPIVARICEIALMRIESDITQRGLNNMVKTEFATQYLTKDIPSWRRLSAESQRNKPAGGLLSGATLNGPLKIEIQIVRNPNTIEEMREKVMSEIEEKPRTKTIDITPQNSQDEPIRLGLFEDKTMQRD